MNRFAKGCQSWVQRRQNNLHLIDKSLLIIPIVEAITVQVIEGRSRTLYFSRPRGFGKSLNMDMLRHFFECPIVAETGEINQPLLARNKDLFVGSEQPNMHPLKITKDFSWEKCQPHFGGYVVVAISFERCKFKDSNLSDFQKVFEEQLLRAYSFYFASNDAVNDCTRYFSPDWQGFERFIAQLSHFHRAKNKKIMVIIDGADAGLNNFHKDSDDNKQIARLIGDLIAYVQNGNKSNIICMGTKNILMDYFPTFCAMTKIACDSVVTPQLQVQQYFGFTGEEVCELVQRTISNYLMLNQEDQNAIVQTIKEIQLMDKAVQSILNNAFQDLESEESTFSSRFKKWIPEGNNIIPLILDVLLTDKLILTPVKDFPKKFGSSSLAELNKCYKDYPIVELLTTGYLTVTMSGLYKICNIETKELMRNMMLQFFKQKIKIALSDPNIPDQEKSLFNLISWKTNNRVLEDVIYNFKLINTIFYEQILSTIIIILIQMLNGQKYKIWPKFQFNSKTPNLLFFIPRWQLQQKNKQDSTKQQNLILTPIIIQQHVVYENSDFQFIESKRDLGLYRILKKQYFKIALEEGEFSSIRWKQVIVRVVICRGSLRSFKTTFCREEILLISRFASIVFKQEHKRVRNLQDLRQILLLTQIASPNQSFVNALKKCQKLSINKHFLRRQKIFQTQGDKSASLGNKKNVLPSKMQDFNQNNDPNTYELS